MFLPSRCFELAPCFFFTVLLEMRNTARIAVPIRSVYSIDSPQHFSMHESIRATAAFARRFVVRAVLLTVSYDCVFGQACAPGELRVLVIDSQGGPVFEAQVRIGPDTAPLAEHR